MIELKQKITTQFCNYQNVKYKRKEYIDVNKLEIGWQKERNSQWVNMLQSEWGPIEEEYQAFLMRNNG